MLSQIAYVSRATDPTSPRDDYDIIRVAQNRNALRGLTGCLVSADGSLAVAGSAGRHRLPGRPAGVTIRR